MPARRGATLWPDGLVGRVIVVLLGALAVEFAGSTLLYEQLDAGSGVYGLLLSAALFAGGVLLAAAMVVHTLAAPLRRLAAVARTIGRGAPVHVADEKGPREVRHMARAFNAMQDRITKLLDERTEALAAVSHDLRTPLTRMRLRVESLPDEQARDTFAADLAEMEQMIAAVLAFLGGERDPEPRRMVDLVSILQTLVDDAADRGADVTLTAPERCRLLARPMELKRAVGNLIENALRYGGGACRVALDRSVAPDGRPMVRIRVDDDGPGIPAPQLERVFEPFQRLDASRNSALGGIGLGLAIVRRAAERDGGHATLHNRPTGGLRAEMLFPAS